MVLAQGRGREGGPAGCSWARMRPRPLSLRRSVHGSENGGRSSEAADGKLQHVTTLDHEQNCTSGEGDRVRRTGGASNFVIL